MFASTLGDRTLTLKGRTKGEILTSPLFATLSTTGTKFSGFTFPSTFEVSRLTLEGKTMGEIMIPCLFSTGSTTGTEFSGFRFGSTLGDATWNLEDVATEDVLPSPFNGT